MTLVIDLRTDTVTQPTPAMRQAMARAEVGDDFYGDDPTVKRLEDLAAEKLGKAAGLFVTSGTMGNLVALLTHCARGDEIIVGGSAHIFTSERGGASALGGLVMRQIPNQPDGTLALDELETAIRPNGILEPRTRMIAVENTHLRANGAPLSPAYLHQVRTIADANDLKIHTDGARIFNAAVAQKVDAAELTRDSDSVQFCLTKGLAAPYGSMLVGARDFITEARRNRQLVGGGVRQAGIMAAAGIVALETMVERLVEDHANAKYLAECLADVHGIELNPAMVKTNMVIFDLMPNGITARALVERVKQENVLLQIRGEYKVRAATHYGITRAHIDTALGAIRHALAA